MWVLCLPSGNFLSCSKFGASSKTTDGQDSSLSGELFFFDLFVGLQPHPVGFLSRKSLAGLLLPSSHASHPPFSPHAKRH